MGETCLVTGAAGFVGAALCRRLLAEGYTVRGLDLRFAASTAPGLERLEGDVNDVSLLAVGCSGARYVFHLAALLPQRRRPPAVMHHVNVEGTQRVLEAATSAAVRRFVLMSSCEVYGVPRTIPCPEDAPPHPNGEYGRNKVEAERLALEAARRGLEVVVLRPPTIVGPGMPEPLLRGTLAALRRGRPVLVPAGSTRFQMVAVSDVVEACLLAASWTWQPEATRRHVLSPVEGGAVPPNRRRPQAAAGNVFNLGSDDVPTLLQATRRLRDRLGSRSPIIPVPLALAQAAFRLLLAIGRSPLEPEHVEIAFSDYVFDTQRAKRLLGWRPAMDNVDALAAAAGM